MLTATLLLTLALANAEPTTTEVATVVANGARTEREVVLALKGQGMKTETREVRRAVGKAIKEGKIKASYRLGWGVWQRSLSK